MLEKSELFYDDKLKVNPSEFSSREAFLQEIEKGCSPDMKSKIFMKGGGAIVGGIGAALVSEGVGIVFGTGLGYAFGARKLSDLEQECKLRNTEGVKVEEIWGTPPASKEKK